MKNYIIVLTFAFLFHGCSKEPTPPNSEPVTPISVVVEGTLFYFVGGGTVEMQFPPGYQLINSKWISPVTKSDTGFSIYLAGSIDSSALGKRVEAFGILDSMKVTYMFSNSSTYAWEIRLDSLRMIQ